MGSEISTKPSRSRRRTADSRCILYRWWPSDHGGGNRLNHEPRPWGARAARRQGGPTHFPLREDEVYTDKVDMTNEEFYERLRDSDVFPTTAQPSPGVFVEAYEALSDYDDILVLTLSSKFSGTYDSALQAAGM